MHLSPKTIRPFARSLGWSPGHRGTLAYLVHDCSYACEGCSERFTETSDLEEGFCVECLENGAPSESDLRRTEGTY